VPGDIVARTAEADEVRLDHLRTPSVDDAAAARTALLRATPDAPTAWVGHYAACLVDYHSGPLPTGQAPALLLYRQRQQPVEYCFGPDCPSHPATYPIDCAMLIAADAMQTLRVEGCWGFRVE
jgi:hypothetical protein